MTRAPIGALLALAGAGVATCLADDVRRTVLRLDPEVSGCGAVEDPCYEAAMAQLAAIAAAHPDEVEAQLLLMRMASAVEDETPMPAAALRARIEERARQDPHDPVAAFLAASELMGDAALQAFDALVAEHPAFTWGRAGRARARAVVCDRQPDSITLADIDASIADHPRQALTPLAYRRGGDGDAAWDLRIEHLRQLVRFLDPLEQITAQRRLWPLQFRAATPDRHAEIRQQVSVDVARLLAQDLGDLPGFWTALRSGYELAGDADAMARCQARMAVLAPCGYLVSSPSQRFESWPSCQEVPAMAPDKLKELAECAQAWAQECPDSFEYRHALFTVIAARRDIPDRELLAEVDGMLVAWERVKRSYGTLHSPYEEAAKALLSRRIDLARARLLLDAQRQWKESQQGKQSLDWLTKDLRAMVLQGQAVDDAGEIALWADAAIQGHRYREAERHLREMEDALAGVTAPDVEQSRLEKEHRYFELRAELARALGKRADAADYRERATAVVVGGDRMPSWQPASRTLPAFELPDVTGKVWRSDDLRGKTVLLNLWTTWCGPCRAELPYVDKLARRVAARTDVAVVAVSLDDNTGLVAPYLARSNIRLLVLLARDYRDLIGDVLLVPQNWIVDAEGTVRRIQQGFTAEGAEDWIESTLREIEGVQRAAAAP